MTGQTQAGAAPSAFPPPTFFSIPLALDTLNSQDSS